MTDRHPVVFVGAGPGDPELITVAGKKTLERADVVVYAGSLVSREMLSWCRPGVETLDSAGLTLEEIVGRLEDAHRAGRRAVRLHTGDPSLYGAIHEQMTALGERGVPFKVIPGVTAAFAASARLAMEYTLPELTQTLILTRAAGRTPVPAKEDLAGLAAHGASLAIYLSAGRSEKVSADLSRVLGVEAPVAVVYRASWPDEQVIITTAGKLAEAVSQAGITKHALILAGPAVATRFGTTVTARSRLYDPGFSHAHRRAEGEED